MHTWFDAQLDQKILDGIYYNPITATGFLEYVYLTARRHTSQISDFVS